MLTIARAPVFVTVTLPLRTLFGFISEASMIVSSGVTVSVTVPAPTLLPGDPFAAVNAALENSTSNTTTAAITPAATSRTIVLGLLVNLSRRACAGPGRGAIMNRLSSASC